MLLCFFPSWLSYHKRYSAASTLCQAMEWVQPHQKLQNLPLVTKVSHVSLPDPPPKHPPWTCSSFLPRGTGLPGAQPVPEQGGQGSACPAPQPLHASPRGRGLWSRGAWQGCRLSPKQEGSSQHLLSRRLWPSPHLRCCDWELMLFHYQMPTILVTGIIQSVALSSFPASITILDVLIARHSACL